MTGLVFIWEKNTLERIVTAHAGPIFSIFYSTNCIVTGAKEKYSERFFVTLVNEFRL